MVQPTPAPRVPNFHRRQQGIGDALSSILGDGDGSSSSNGSSNDSDGGSSDNGGSSENGGSSDQGNSSGGGNSSNDNSSGSGGNSSGGSGQSSNNSSNNSSGQSSQQSSQQATSAAQTTDASSVVSQVTNNQGTVVRTTIVSQDPVVSKSTASASSTASVNSDSSNSSSSSNGGTIGGAVGGVVGGLALITLLVLIGLLWRRRRARTGHGWFLCFGRRPHRKHDLDVDWPTFDPALGAAGVGGTMGDGAGYGSNRRRSGAFQSGHQGTLPMVDGEGNEYYGSHEEMRETGSNAPYNASTYYSGPNSDGYGNHSTEAASAQNGWGLASYSQNHSTPSQQNDPPRIPDYGHLDPPEIREQRAREQAEAQAQAMTAYQQNGNTESSLNHHRTNSYLSSHHAVSPPASPPPRNNTDHRFSAGTAAMLADNNFFMSGQHRNDESGTVIDDGHQKTLHLHNPDA